MASSSSKQSQRRKKKTTIPRTTISDLPHLLITDILSRLPSPTVVHCMCLCKTLLASVHHDPHFAQIHLSNSPKTPLSLLCPPSFDLVTGGSACLLDEHIHGGRISGKKSIVGKFNSGNFPPGALEVAGSCNGLLLCLDRNHDYSKYDYDLFICNPIRKSDWVKLPKPAFKSDFMTAYGLGFCSRTNLYKVIRINVINNSYGRGFHFLFEVLIVGSQSWVVSFAPFRGELICARTTPWTTPPWVAHNGSLHTLFEGRVGEDIVNSLHIACFQIAEEGFTVLGAPVRSIRNSTSSYSLGVLRDCLSLSCVTDMCRVEIWVMSEYGVEESWSKRWVIESNVLRGLRIELLQPMKLREEEGEVLMAYEHPDCFAMVCYSPAMAKISKHKLPSVGNVCRRVGYVPSFVSPKDVVMRC